MFTPGDNDWTDCDRPSNGGFNSLERLDHERQVFFSTTARSAARRRSSRSADRADLPRLGLRHEQRRTRPPCVENRRWTFKDVTYATLNVQGSCNNLCDSGGPDPGDE